jgi:hypothetical protein
MALFSGAIWSVICSSLTLSRVLAVPAVSIKVMGVAFVIHCSVS